MDTTRKLMQFHFIANAETATHYHQNPEMFYVLRGNLDIKIDDKTYKMQSRNIVLINANKRHTVIGNVVFTIHRMRKVNCSNIKTCNIYI